MRELVFSLAVVKGRPAQFQGDERGKELEEAHSVVPLALTFRSCIDCRLDRGGSDDSGMKEAIATDGAGVERYPAAFDLNRGV